MLRDENGKLSFSRIFGSSLGSLVLVGWVFDGLALLDFALPSQTPVLLLIGLTPYLGSKAVDLMKVVGPYLGRK